MKKKSTLRSAGFNPRALMILFLCCAGVLIAFFAVGASTGPFQRQGAGQRPNKARPGALTTMRAISHELDPLTVAAFNPAGGTWTVTGSLNTPRAGHTATLLPNGVVLAAGGGATLASAELYDPAGGSWAATGSLNTPRSDHTATLLPNGMVLVAGGRDSNSSFSPIATAELYDPASGTWTTVGNLSTARYFHTATLLPNGMVLAAGGVDSLFIASANAELFDPASGSWTATSNLNTARESHTGTLLPNGMVLAVGGFGSNGNVSSSAELFAAASLPTPTPTPSATPTPTPTATATPRPTVTPRPLPTPRPRPSPRPRP